MSWKCRWGSVELPEFPQAASCWPAATRPHPDRPTAQVGQGGVDPVAQVEHDVVAEDPPRPERARGPSLGRLARERLIAATPALQARRLAKTLRWEQAIAARLAARGSSGQEALLAPKVALACFQAAYERWVRDPGQDLPALVDESFAALAGLTG